MYLVRTNAKPVYNINTGMNKTTLSMVHREGNIEVTFQLNLNFDKHKINAMNNSAVKFIKHSFPITDTQMFSILISH